MDKETLSHYGWIVVLILVLSVMLALATPFGNFISTAIKSTTTGFYQLNQNALGIVGVAPNDQEFPEPPTANDGKIEYGVADPDLNLKDDTIELVNETTYEYGDYIYKYYEKKNIWNVETISGWEVSLNLDVTDKTKKYYGPILESINGQPIVDLYGTFSDCTNLETSPIIPNTVSSMADTFFNCTSLTNAPIVPHNIISMDGTFKNCTNLTVAPDISQCAKLYTLDDAFYGCTNLETYHNSTSEKGDFSGYIIPNAVTTMDYSFLKCEAIKIAPNLSKATNLKSMYGTFQFCYSLQTPSIIPESVTTISYIFFNCTSLTIAPSIPQNATEMYSAFNSCTSLTTAPDMSNATSLTDMRYAFEDCTSLIIAPTLPNNVTRLSRTFKNCTSLTTASTIPNSVLYMDETFYGCTSLTGIIEINAHLSSSSNYWFGCFENTNKEIILTGTCPYLSRLTRTADDENVKILGEEE